MNDTMSHGPGCTRPDPWRDRFKPGWVRLKCPECKHVDNVAEVALLDQDNAKRLAPATGYRCRDHHSQPVNFRGKGCKLCPTRKANKRKATVPSEDYEQETYR